MQDTPSTDNSSSLQGWSKELYACFSVRGLSGERSSVGATAALRLSESEHAQEQGSSWKLLWDLLERGGDLGSWRQVKAYTAFPSFTLLHLGLSWKSGDCSSTFRQWASSCRTPHPLHGLWNIFYWKGARLPGQRGKLQLQEAEGQQNAQLYIAPFLECALSKSTVQNLLSSNRIQRY